MNVKIRTILSCPNQQQQKQKKTSFDRYNFRVMQGSKLWALFVRLNANQ